jgi:hypothetical protein
MGTLNAMNATATSPPRIFKHRQQTCVAVAVAMSMWLTAGAAISQNIPAPPSPPAGQPEPEPAAAPRPPRPPGPVDTKASRLVDEIELEAYIDGIASIFSMANRAADPFGVFQDPDAKPAPPPMVQTTAQRIPEVATPFSEIVRRIEVTTVMPGERQFLIGTRAIRQGQQFPVNFRGRRYMLVVDEVSSRRIVFRNAENDETANRELALLPDGMRPGSGDTEIPGLMPAGRDAPINLDQADP